MGAEPMKRTELAGSGRRGQTTTEFAIVMAMVTLSALILAVFLYAFREFGGRILTLVSSEYP